MAPGDTDDANGAVFAASLAFGDPAAGVRRGAARAVPETAKTRRNGSDIFKWRRQAEEREGPILVARVRHKWLHLVVDTGTSAACGRARPSPPRWTINRTSPWWRSGAKSPRLARRAELPWTARSRAPLSVPHDWISDPPICHEPISIGIRFSSTGAVALFVIWNVSRHGEWGDNSYLSYEIPFANRGRSDHEGDHPLPLMNKERIETWRRGTRVGWYTKCIPSCGIFFSLLHHGVDRTLHDSSFEFRRGLARAGSLACLFFTSGVQH